MWTQYGPFIAYDYQKMKFLTNSNISFPEFFPEWCHEYNNRIPDISLLQKEIDIFMENFDDEAHGKALKEKEMMQEDEEGWITVTKR
jgi:hypothetical protein